MTTRPADGVLPVDKPEGPTSHAVVQAARRALGTRRIGHTGTLDPFASGLLLLCVGHATRVAEYLSGLPKQYHAVARLGETTDTDDRDGAVIHRSEACRGMTREAVESAFLAFQGRIVQVPPVYSAKKVGGEPLYRKARRGEAHEPEPVAVEVFSLRVTEMELPEVSFEVSCSSGTYIRAIARDAGRLLGCGAHLRALRRTAVGHHRVDSAVPLPALADPAAVAAAWITPLQAVAHLPTLHVDADSARRLAHGLPVPLPPSAPPTGIVALAAEGELVAIGNADQGRFRPRKVFPRAA